MKVIVLGGTRFIGPWAVRRLVAMGHDVTVVHRGSSEPDPALPPAVEHVHDPNARSAEMLERLAARRPDVVLDMRPVDERDARAVVDAFRDRAARVVAISSADVYRSYGCMLRIESAEPERQPMTEESPLRTALRPYRAQATGPEDYRYNYDKIPAEEIFLGDAKLPGTILRLPMVYGPGDYQHRLFEVLKRVDDGRRVLLVPRSIAGWLSARSYVEDVGEAIALAVSRDRAAGRVYNVAENPPSSELAWIHRVAAACDFSGTIEVVPDEELPPHLHPDFDTAHHLALATDRIREELGYRETLAAGEAMRRTVAWERRNPPAKIDPKSFDYPAEDAAYLAWRGRRGKANPD